MTPAKEESAHLKIIKTSGADVYLHKNRQFGTWSVSLARGSTPALLLGEWQSFNALVKLLEFYLSNNKRKRVIMSSTGVPVDG